jgi:O-antigen ligase
LYLLCVWTQSRVAWFAIPFTILILASGRGWKAAVGMAGLASMALVLFYFADPTIRERFDRTFFQRDALLNITPRIKLWRAQLELFKQSPIFGVGYNNNERYAKEVVDRLYPDSENFYGHAHSTPLQLLATTGALGFLCYLALWWEIFRRALQLLKALDRRALERWLTLSLTAGFVGFHLQGLTQWNFGDAEVLHNLMFFWAVLAALHVSLVPRGRSGYNKKI